jgi:DNA-binding NtrC family response regulator
MPILVLDDDSGARRSLVRIVQRMPEAEVYEAATIDEARLVLEQHDIEVALIDLRLAEGPDNRDGLRFVSEVRARSSAVPIVVTGSSEMSEVRAAMRAGAHAYILKEELSDELVRPILEGIRSQRRLEREVIALRARASGGTDGFVGTTAPARRLRETIQRVATSDRPVLVTGPTGAGKEVVVRALHACGAHPEAPFIDLNCGALPPNLIESQLFGHERGAFTGADRRSVGFFASVGEGTLFLDEIAELPLDLQSRLLRVLETGTFRPVGATAVERFVGRVVAATHAELAERVRRGEFREDLYYRLNVLEIRVPSLAERVDDIAALVAHFAARQTRRMVFSADAFELMRRHSWPGNVRELRNLIDRLSVFAPDGPITAEVIQAVTNDQQKPRANAVTELVRAVLRGPEGDKLQAAEALLIEEALRLTDGNKAAAARLLGVNRKVVERRCERLAATSEPGDEAASSDPDSPVERH